MHGECDANKGPQSDSLPNRMYILPHVQEFLAGLDSTREDGLTRWTLGVRNAVESGDALPPSPTAEWNLGAQTELEAGDELPPFPTTAGVTPEGMDKAVKSGPQTRAQVEQGGAVGSAAGSRHAEGDRDAVLTGQVGSPRQGPVPPLQQLRRQRSLGQLEAHRPRLRAAKVEGGQTTELPVQVMRCLCFWWRGRHHREEKLRRRRAIRE